MDKFQTRCDTTAKTLAVLMTFLIPISTTLMQIVLGLLIIVFFAAGTEQLRARAKLIYAHPVSRAALMLFLVFCIGILYSTATINDSLAMLAKMAKILCIPLLLPLFVEEKWRRAAIIALVAAMGLTLLLSLLKVYGGLPIRSRFTEACVFKNHIDSNLLMSIAAFCVGQMFLQARERWIKISLAIVLALMTFYILWMSDGRMGYVIFATLWLLFLVQHMQLKTIIVGTGVLLLILGVSSFGPSRLQHRMTLLSEEVELYKKKGSTEQSLGQRLEFAQSSFEIAKKQIWFGVGTGGYKQAYSAFAEEKGLATTANAHNEYLNILVQWGIMGLLAFAALFWTLIKTSFNLEVPERFFLQSIILAMLLGSTANSWLMDFTSGYFFVTFAALCAAALPVPVAVRRPQGERQGWNRSPISFFRD